MRFLGPNKSANLIRSFFPFCSDPYPHHEQGVPSKQGGIEGLKEELKKEQNHN